MIGPKRTIGMCLLLSGLLSTVAAHAATYYVATTGNNSNPGTEEQPWRTVAYAARQLFAGDTVYVKNGTYTEELIQIRRSGTASAPIKLLAFPGHAPVISFNDCGLSCPRKERKYLNIILQVPPGHNKEIAWVSVEGFIIENGVSGFKWYQCRNCTFRRNHIRNTYGSGIYGRGAVDTVIDGNIIESAGSPETGAHGLYLAGSRYIITNNLIYGSEKYGIQLNGIEDPNNTVDFAGPDFAMTQDVLIANNVLAYSRIRAGIVVWGPRANRARIENNIFHQNGQDDGNINGIAWVGCCSTGAQIRNNIFYATSPRALTAIQSNATEGVHYTQSGNLINASEPGLVNAPATLPTLPDFRLTERSSAIDKGLLLTAAKTAFDGTSRPQGRGYDIGPYEYSAGNDAQSPAAPIALQIR